MTIYEHRTDVTTASGSVASISLRMPGGILRDVLVRANTSSSCIFAFNLTDENGVVRQNYAFHRGELHDTQIQLPVTGKYTANITNASPDDTFTLILAVQEN